jgi:hypothetical protein
MLASSISRGHQEYIARLKEETAERERRYAALVPVIASPKSWKVSRSGMSRVAPELVVIQEFLAQFRDTDLLAGAKPIKVNHELVWEPFFARGDRPFTPIKSCSHLRRERISSALKELCSPEIILDPTLKASSNSLKLSTTKTDPEADRCISLDLENLESVKMSGIVLWWVQGARSHVRQHGNFPSQGMIGLWDASEFFSIRQRALQSLYLLNA